MNKIILIGGSPTTGKSHSARKISKFLNLPWISTDTIRKKMRKSVKKEDCPALFDFAEATPEMAVEYLTSHSAQEIVKDQNKESSEVWKGVMEIIEKTSAQDSIIIEGIAILPHLVAKLNNKKVRAVFLVDEDADRIRKIIFKRGLWDDAEKYPDSVKKKEVEWVLAFNNYILKEAKKYKLSVVKIGDRKQYLSKLKELVK